MDDSGAVDGVEAAQRLDRERGGIAGSERPARLDQLVKIRPLDELPDHVAGAVVQGREVEQRGDVRVLDLRGEPRLAQEALVRPRLARNRRAHQLDDADRVEVDVEDLVDLPHPADAELRQDLVLAVERLLQIAAQKVRNRFTAEGTSLVGGIDLGSAVDAEEGHGDLDLLCDEL